MQAESADQLRVLLSEAVGNSKPAAVGAASDPVGTVGSIGQTIKHHVPLPEDAADIVQTIGKLKALSPLYTYAMYHPIRFLWRFLILPLPSLVLFLVIAILQILAYVLKSLLFPVYVAVTFATAPIRIALHFLNALMPVWIFLGTAIFIGCAVGAVAGLLMGGTTRYALDQTVDVVVWPLRVIGLIEPPKRRPIQYKSFGSNGGARIENVEKGRNGTDRAIKRQVSTTDEDEDENETKPSTTLVDGYSKRRSTGSRPSRRRMGSTSSSSFGESSSDEARGGSRFAHQGHTRKSSRGAKGKAVESGWRKRHVAAVLQ
ncbi:uncharacterized protein JCM15063_003474 [Sporobolomyces koalae]|uniref:uncharacterized protein n=1 Tax=Sporobolomyces koalae TaxID=500713 RepID=UPI0031812C5D